jgi:starch synthase
MRVDLITKEYPPHIYGGAGVHVAELVRVLRRSIDVQVRCFGDDRDEKDTKSYGFSNVFDEANPAIQTMATDLAMVSDCAGTDLVHSHTWYANFAGQVAGQLHNVPHLITAHSLEPLRPWKADQLGGGYAVSSWIERSAYEAATGIIAVSHGMRADILRAYPQIDPQKVSVVHNGIDLAVFQNAANADVVRSLGINPDQRSVVFVGRITQQKGLPYLLKAARELPGDVQLVLCAGAPDTKEIQQQVTDLVEELQQVRGGVIWIERHLSRSELIAVLSSATVFACPSIYEPLGIVNLEAMACGIPVVATATGGIPEVVAHGETGLLVPIEQVQDGSGKPLDEAKFVKDTARALQMALEESDLSAMGTAGRKRVEDHFSWDAIAEDTIKVYRNAIESFV